MVLTTKIVIALVACGLAVPLTTSLQKGSPIQAAPDPLVGRWNRHVNAEPIEGYRQYLELKAGGRYSFGTVINGRNVEESFGTWKRNGQKIVFKADAQSRQEMLIDSAELVDGSMLRFSPLHGFCKRSHPHEPIREPAPAKPTANARDEFVSWLDQQPKGFWRGRYCTLAYERDFREFHARLTGDIDKARQEARQLLKAHGLDLASLERGGKLLFIE